MFMAGSLALLAVVACGGSTTGPRAGLDQTVVGKNRCLDARRRQTAPFVVEWDATDLSSFEALAARDVAFVRYEGCELELLTGCNDGSVPGRYGRYQPPQFTSGGDESLEIHNDDDLYAKLPLGVAAFGGKVNSQQGLRLHYHVTAVSTASRDAIPASDLATNPQCRGATHFVQAFHLGAFELDSDASMKASAEAGSVQGVGAGVKHSSSEKSLKKAGKLDDCQGQAQTACRVPIRLVLRELGAQGAGDTPGAVAAPPLPTNHADTPESKAYQLRLSAGRKESESADGVGCLEDLDRADRLDPSGAHGQGTIYTRALCLMRVGRCDEGKNYFRDFTRAVDTKHELTDQELEQRVTLQANNKCPSTAAGSDEEQAKRGLARVVEASQQKTVQVCLDETKRVVALAEKSPPPVLAKPLNPIRQSASGAISIGALCLAKAGRCDEAHDLYLQLYRITSQGIMSDKDIKTNGETMYGTAAPMCKK